MPITDLAAATTLIRIGYWERTASMAAGPEDTSWPRAEDMVDDSWDAADFFRTFLWPQGLSHYVRHHAVRLPDVFLEHVIAVRGAIEAAPVEESWWKSLRVAD